MGFCKYYKQKKIVSYDSGTTWQDVVPYEYQVGSLYQRDSADCQEGETITRWVTVPGDFICEGKDKYELKLLQFSKDNGVTWSNSYPPTYETGNLIESNSIICDNKWEGHYLTDNSGHTCPDCYSWVYTVGCVHVGCGGGGYTPKNYGNIRVDPIKYVRCASSSSTTLTRTDVLYDPYELWYGYIGDCVDTIGNGAFSGMTEISYMDIPSSVTIIGAWAFLECTSLSSITIPDSVTWIGDNAFAYCYDLSNVTIGSGVTTIGSGAFRYCSNLESIFVDSNNSVYDSRNNCNAIIETSTNKLIAGGKNTIIPSTITSIGNYAFVRCNGITSINIPDSVTSIGADSFAGCGSLTSCTIGSGVTSIGADAFLNCSGLTSITLFAPTPPTLSSYFVFSGSTCPIYVPCESIAAYKSASGWTDYLNRIQAITPCKQPIPGVTKYYATYLNNDSRTYMIDCNSSTELTSGDTRPSSYTASSATSIYVGNCVSSLGDGVFKDFTSISSCTFETNSQLTTIGSSAFTYCSGLTSINIPDSVTSIGNYAFFSCRSLSSCTIGSGVTSIGYEAFQHCSGLTSVNIPNSVETIYSYAFANCSSLTNIEIPSSVTFIGYKAFNYCSGLLSITVNSSTPPELDSWGGYDVFGYTNNCTIYVPCEAVDTYKSANGWSTYESRIQGLPPCEPIPTGTKFFATYTGGATYSAGCDSSTELTTAVTKTSIYEDDTMLTAEIGNCVTSIGETALEYCTSLSSVTIPSGVTTIGFNAFAYCSGLTSITIPSGVTRINDGVFGYCSGLTSIDIPSGVTYIGRGAFTRCTSLTSINIPDSVTSIGTYAFERCTGATSITIGSGVTEIGGRAFQRCYSLNYIIINATTPPDLELESGGGNYSFYNTNNCPIYVPSASVNMYKTYPLWSTYADRIFPIP